MKRIRRLEALIALATLLVLAAATPVQAVTWAGSRKIGTATGAIVSIDPALARTGSTSAVIVFGDRDGPANMDRVYVRRDVKLGRHVDDQGADIWPLRGGGSRGGLDR